MAQAIGVDIGATKIAAGRILRNRIVEQVEFSTLPEFKAATLQNLRAAIELVLAPEVRHIGIGIAGVVSQGRVFNETNLRTLNGMNIQRHIEKIFKMPCVVENDAKCFTLGEWKYGRWKTDSLVGITLGTGFGVGIIDEGKLLRGAHGAAGEFSKISLGKYTIDDYGERMLNRCLRAQKLRMDAAEAHALARKGNRAARQAFAAYGRELAKPVSAVINAIDPEVLVIGGGIGQAFPFFVKTLRAGLAEQCYSKVLSRLLIRKGRVKSAGVLGAALLTKY